MALAGMNIFFVVLAILICFVTATFMFIVCYRGCVRKLKNALLLSFGLSDFFVGFLVIPFTMLCSDETFSSCAVCVTSYVLNRFASVSSAIHLIAVIYERYLKIVHPYWFDSHEETRLRSVCIIPALWLTSLLISATPLAWMLVKMCRSQQSVDYTMYYDYVCLAFIIFLVVLMVFAFARIYYIVRCHLQGIRTTHIPQSTVTDGERNSRHPPSPVVELQRDSREHTLDSLAGSPTNSQCKFDNSRSASPRSARYWLMKEARVITRFVAMVIIFIISWGGYFYISTQQQRKNDDANVYVITSFAVMHFGRSLVNPWIITVNNRDFHGTWAVFWGFLTRILARFRRKAADQRRPYTSDVQERSTPTVIYLNEVSLNR